MQHATCKHWGAGTFESLSVLTDLKLGKTTTTGGGGIGEGNQLVAVPSMRGLDRLRSLELSNNNLTDIPAGAPLYAAIPRIFFSLFYLCSAVSRHRCALTSQVCPVIYIYTNAAKGCQWWKLTRLLQQWLAGTFDNLVVLQQLLLYSNQIRGVSPSAFQTLTALQSLDISDNQLHGFEDGAASLAMIVVTCYPCL